MSASLHLMTEGIVRRALSNAPANPTEWLISNVLKISELDRLARSIRRRPACETIAMLDLPVELPGGVRLWRLTIGAETWMEERGIPWMGDPDARTAPVYVWGWAMAHAHDPDAFSAVDSPYKTRAAVRAWKSLLQCSSAALSAAVDELMASIYSLPDGIPTAEIAEEPKLSRTLSVLALKYGGCAFDWMWRKPKAEALEALNALADDGDADAREIARQSKSAPDTDSWESRVTIAFNRAAKRLCDSASQAAKADGEIPPSDERGPVCADAGVCVIPMAVGEPLEQGIDSGAYVHRDHGAAHLPSEVVPGEHGTGGEERTGDPVPGQNQPDAGEQSARNRMRPILFGDRNRPHGGIIQ